MPKPSPRAREVRLSLTGKDSHVVWFEPGVGNLYVGCKPQSRMTPQAIVDPDARIAWDELDGVGFRWLDYEGNDTSIFEWLARRERPIERVLLRPCAPIDADASRARVDELFVDAVHGHAVRLVVPTSETAVLVEEATDAVELSNATRGAALRSLGLWVTRRERRAPFYEGLADVRDLRLGGAGVDLENVGRYREARRLSVRCPVGDLAPLAELTQLETLVLYEAWDLGSLPSLAAWPRLRELAIYGLRKRDAVRIGRAAEDFPRVSLTLARQKSDAWIAKRPRFDGWDVPAAALRSANAAFAEAKKTLAMLKKADATRARAAVERFVDALNAEHGKKGRALMTSEREDVAVAIDELFATEILAPLADEAREWFDARREF